MLPGLISTGFGVLVFLFIFWKRLREDYAPAIIFEISFYILLGIAVTQLISFRLIPDWFFWTSILGALVGLYLGNLRFKVRFYEAFEAVVIGLLPWGSFIFLKDSVARASLGSFIGFLGVLLIIFIFYYVDTHFREFTWYKSGKVGFAGLSILALIFTVRSTIALIGISVLTFSGNYEAMVSGAAALVCFVLLFNLSRKIE
jgi:hypothetical protein